MPLGDKGLQRSRDLEGDHRSNGDGSFRMEPVEPARRAIRYVHRQVTRDRRASGRGGGGQANRDRDPLCGSRERHRRGSRWTIHVRIFGMARGELASASPARATRRTTLDGGTPVNRRSIPATDRRWRRYTRMTFHPVLLMTADANRDLPDVIDTLLQIATFADIRGDCRRRDDAVEIAAQLLTAIRLSEQGRSVV